MPILAILFTGWNRFKPTKPRGLVMNTKGVDSRHKGVGFRQQGGQYPGCKGMVLQLNRVGS
jgi:hypothetical protein